MNDDSSNTNRITFKVWLEIEEYDEVTGHSHNRDAPGACLAEFDTYEEAHRFAVTVQFHEFPQPCNSQSHRTNQPVLCTPGTLLAGSEVTDAITTVVDYLWDDELADYSSALTNDPQTAAGHIFTSLARIRNWLEGAEAAVKDWHKNR